MLMTFLYLVPLMRSLSGLWPKSRVFISFVNQNGLTRVLGVCLYWIHKGQGSIDLLQLSQKVYIESVLRSFGMTHCKLAITPMVETFFESKDVEQEKIL